jgi:hypothetical protein
MKNRIGCYRTLIPTGFTLKEGPLGVKIVSVMTAVWTLKFDWPTSFDQVIPTFMITGKHLLKPKKINGFIHNSTLKYSEHDYTKYKVPYYY